MNDIMPISGWLTALTILAFCVLVIAVNVRRNQDYMPNWWPLPLSLTEKLGIVVTSFCFFLSILTLRW